LSARDDARRDLIQAWQAVRIYVQTRNDHRMPSLSSLLPDDPRQGRQRQSPEEQRAAIYMLSQMYGGTVREIPPKVVN